MAEKKIYQHHERDTDAGAISDVQEREMVYTSQADCGIFKNAGGTARWVPMLGTRALTSNGTNAVLTSSENTILEAGGVESVKAASWGIKLGAQAIVRSVQNDELVIYGGTDGSGAYIRIHGANHSAGQSGELMFYENGSRRLWMTNDGDSRFDVDTSSANCFTITTDNLSREYIIVDSSTEKINIGDAVNNVSLVLRGAGTLQNSGHYVGTGMNLVGIVNAGEDTDKFLVLDSDNNVDFRTGDQVASDIGASSTWGSFIGTIKGATGVNGTKPFQYRIETSSYGTVVSLMIPEIYGTADGTFFEVVGMDGAGCEPSGYIPYLPSVSVWNSTTEDFHCMGQINTNGTIQFYYPTGTSDSSLTSWTNDGNTRGVRPQVITYNTTQEY